MQFWVKTNQAKYLEWGLNKNEASLLDFMCTLSSWANISIVDGKKYFLLYIDKILNELPILGSRSSVSRALNGLEKKDLVESINKRSRPSYRVTEKGKEWVQKPSKDIETAKRANKKKNFSFDLGKPTKFADLSDEYEKYLKLAAEKYLNENNIHCTTFRQFRHYYLAKGTKYSNWSPVFKEWVFVAQTKEKNDDSNGLYQ